MIINTHTHIFINKNLPLNALYIPYLIPFLNKSGIDRIFSIGLHTVWPFSKNDTLSRLGAFLLGGKYQKQEEIFKEMKKYYPEDTKFVLLSLDFEYMNAGKVNKKYNFIKQLDELAVLKENYPETVYPFICADPRRENITSMVKHYIEKRQFCGIKIYPPFGYFPDDERLSDIYNYAIQNNLPIIGHTMLAAPIVHSRSRKEAFKNISSRFPISKFVSQRALCSYYSHPDNYERLLKKYNSLKLNLAHAGDIAESYYLPKKKHEKNWYGLIKSMLNNPAYKNLYTDISFSKPNKLLDNRIAKLLKNKATQRKILFGSDYYMNKLLVDESIVIDSLKKSLSVSEFKMVTFENPGRFLNCD
ncbi:MAG: amidohydrolase family protein [Desulfobacteraceae bacterium]|nr:amidohydrolase family protein [Desulfobacteraceae bacterium]